MGWYDYIITDADVSHVLNITRSFAVKTTEKEAKFKYCPLLVTPDGKFKFCQGSACMMWRFSSPDATNDTDLGYCGVAGLPKIS